MTSTTQRGRGRAYVFPTTAPAPANAPSAPRLPREIFGTEAWAHDRAAVASADPERKSPNLWRSSGRYLSPYLVYCVGSGKRDFRILRLEGNANLCLPGRGAYQHLDQEFPSAAMVSNALPYVAIYREGTLQYEWIAGRWMEPEIEPSEVNAPGTGPTRLKKTRKGGRTP